MLNKHTHDFIQKVITGYKPQSILESTQKIEAISLLAKMKYTYCKSQAHGGIDKILKEESQQYEFERNIYAKLRSDFKAFRYMDFTINHKRKIVQDMQASDNRIKDFENKIIQALQFQSLNQTI